jgi:hypothetical protein
MAQDDTLILRAALFGALSIYRDIAIEPSQSLYRLAEAIVAAFGFDFDHAFGFYTGLNEQAMWRQHPKYELFADMGEADRDVFGVKKTRVAQAFPAVGHTLLFLFDYGDEWHFRVKLTKSGKKLAKVKYPHIVASRGEAPKQYPDLEEYDDGGPRYGINLATGERIKIG